MEPSAKLSERENRIPMVDVCLSRHATERIAERGPGHLSIDKRTVIRLTAMKRAQNNRTLWILRLAEGYVIGRLYPRERGAALLLVVTFLLPKQFLATQLTNPLIPQEVCMFRVRRIYRATPTNLEADLSGEGENDIKNDLGFNA